MARVSKLPTVVEIVKEEPPKKKPINSELVKLTDSTKRALPKKLKPVANKVRTFFLTDLAPLAIASFMGVEQARQVLQDALGVPIDSSVETKFKSLMVKAIDIRMARYVQKLTGLSPDDAELLLDSLKPRKPANIVMPLGSPYEAKAKYKKDKEDSSGRRHNTGRQGEVDLP